MDVDIIKNTVLDIYPVYIKKMILKQVTDYGLVIDCKKKNGQRVLNFTGCVDVSDDVELDKKIIHMLEQESVRAYIEEYEYKKAYRHFCYFKYEQLQAGRIEQLIKDKRVMVFDKQSHISADCFEKPTVYLTDECIYIKFSDCLKNDKEKAIKYIILAIIDKDNQILEIRFDKIGIAYKNSYTYYKDKVLEILDFLRWNIGLVIENIDFKAVVEFMKDEKEDITILAQRMTRNGTTAYLEAYDDVSIMPILGELDKFISVNADLFKLDENTRKIEKKLQEFIREIEKKSDLPMVKIRMDDSGIKFGVTHNYKGTDFSLFMLYDELVGEKEMMSSVKKYIMGCCRDFDRTLSNDTVPTKEVQGLFCGPKSK